MHPRTHGDAFLTEASDCLTAHLPIISGYRPTRWRSVAGLTDLIGFNRDGFNRDGYHFSLLRGRPGFPGIRIHGSSFRSGVILAADEGLGQRLTCSSGDECLDCLGRSVVEQSPELRKV